MIALLSTADTDLLAAQASGEDWLLANPARLDPLELPELLGDVKIVVLRLLGGKATWPQGLSAVLDLGLPTLVLGGEAVADPELMALSTVPVGIATQALAYLVAGGAENFSSLAAFCGTRFCSQVKLSRRRNIFLNSEHMRPNVMRFQGASSSCCCLLSCTCGEWEY